MAWTAACPRWSSRTFGKSCSARPAITPSGVDTSCATPIARVPSVAARVARASRASCSSRSAARASSRSSSSSFRWFRSATTPKASSSPVAVSTLRMARCCAQQSRSRSRRAVAATAMIDPPSGPRVIGARPTKAARVGRPNSPASVLERGTIASPRRAAPTTRSAMTGSPWPGCKREPSGDKRNTLNEPCRSTAANSRDARAATDAESPSVRTPRAAAIPRARFTCSSARSSSAARAARNESQYARPPTSPIARPTEQRRREVRTRARRSPAAVTVERGRAMVDAESLEEIATIADSG